jgi:hypothetical protein
MMRVFAPVVICQCLNNPAITEAAVAACVHHPLEFGAKL